MSRLAAAYDLGMAPLDALGLARLRRALTAGVVGEVLEIGVGTGRQLGYYGPHARVTGIDADAPALTRADARLRSRAAGDETSRLRREPSNRAERDESSRFPRDDRSPRDDDTSRLVQARAEDLPFPADAFDWAVSALCLCGVEDPVRAAGELVRVLRPGGRLRALEHVRSPRRRLARLQRGIDPVWRRVCGCQCDRPTAETLRAAGFAVAVRRSLLGGALVLLEGVPPAGQASGWMPT